MAALVRHVLPNTNLLCFQTTVKYFSTSSSLSKKTNIFKIKKKKWHNDTTLDVQESFFPLKESIMARGFLRSQKPYEPPENVDDMLKTIGKKILNTTEYSTTLIDPDVRFKLFYECEKNFNHRIPNSLLHTMRTLRDVYEYYVTPVDIRTPLDALKQVNLPPNLHIQYEPHRFHPDEDTMFNGKSAFPQSSTLVTGLKTRRKFKGYEAKQELEY